MRNRPTTTRCGVTTVETATILCVLLLLLLGTLDLGIAVVRYNVLAAAARRVTREAIVHGAEAAPERTAWGPNDYSGTAADGSEIAAAALPYLPTINPSEVAMQVNWPDGDHQEGDRVRVRMAYVHHAVVPLMPSHLFNLRAECTMRIVH